MFYGILSKLVSEALLSLYPIFVKNIGLPISLQIWSRFFSYAAISLFFINPSFILQNLFSKNGLLLSVVTMAHIYTSYYGFYYLESGIAYTIFYLYPIMILFMAQKSVHPIMVLSLLGVYLLSSGQKETLGLNEDFTDEHKEKEKEKALSNGDLSMSNTIKGLIMIVGAAFTEALIYFIVRNIKTENHWNHIFLSYFWGSILMSGFLFSSVAKIKMNSVLSLSLIINIVIGLFGYLLRFFAVYNLDATIYAVLSYFGIFMAYVYGVFISGDKINLQKLIGTFCIILPNLFLVKQT